jgi:hypothetical protein
MEIRGFLNNRRRETAPVTKVPRTLHVTPLSIELYEYEETR